MLWIAVGVGGALGSMARHWGNLEMSHRLERTVPHATFLVNVIGCLLIGALAGMVASGRLHLTPTMRTFIFVGMIGGFTTFRALVSTRSRSRAAANMHKRFGTLSVKSRSDWAPSGSVSC